MSESELKRSEAEVQKSTAEFDQAMQHLEETIQDSSEKVTNTVERVQEVIQRPVRMMKAARERIKQSSARGRYMATQYGRITRDQAQMLYRKAQDSTGPMIESTRKHPMLAGSVAGAFALGVGSLVLLSKRKRTSKTRSLLGEGEKVPIIRKQEQIVVTDIDQNVA